MIRVLSAVTPSSKEEPVSSEIAIMAGVAIFVSIVEVAESGPVLPATSVAVAEKLWLAVLRGGPAYSKLQPPVGLVMVVPMTLEPTRVTLTVLPGSAVPVKVNVPISAISAIAGAAGGIKSTVTRNGGAVCGPVRLLASVAVAVKRVLPLGNDVPE